MIEIIVLGSGTVEPNPKRASAGFLVKYKDKRLMIDIGAGTLRNAQLCGSSLCSLETLLLTHLHPDHTADLVPFLFARRCAPGEWENHRMLTVYGPSGVKNFFTSLFSTWPHLSDKDNRLRIIELESEDPVEIDDFLKLEPFRVQHCQMSAFSYRLEVEGRAIAFSGDTAFCPGVISAARKADLFFCELSCPTDGVSSSSCRKNHLNWEDVVQICQQSQPATLVLTHLYDEVISKQPNLVDIMQKQLSIEVSLGSDCRTYRIGA